MELARLLGQIESSFIIKAALIYLAIYPVIFGFIWSLTALGYYFIRERHFLVAAKGNYVPKISIVIPAHNEETVLAEMMEAVLKIDYPWFEVVVVDDGSTDNTLDVLKTFLEHPQVRVISKVKNEGKATALNAATKHLNGEVVLYLDADALPEKDILKYIIPHFSNPKVGAVTGNPRVRNISSLFGCLQLMEYTSIVSLIRRTQHLWGALLSVAGLVVAVRKEALLKVGGFRPNMSTEDICLTWDLQRTGYKVSYESYAVVWMMVPTKLWSLIKQRMRWAKGQMEVLHLHRGVFLDSKPCVLWLVYIEALMSLFWMVLYAFFVLLFVFTLLMFSYPLGVGVVPLFWGVIIACTSLFMQLVGVFVENSHDKTAKYFYPYAILYPLIYWMLLSVIAVVRIPYLFMTIKKGRHITWEHERGSNDESK